MPIRIWFFREWDDFVIAKYAIGIRICKLVLFIAITTACGRMSEQQVSDFYTASAPTLTMQPGTQQPAALPTATETLSLHGWPATETPTSTPSIIEVTPPPFATLFGVMVSYFEGDYTPFNNLKIRSCAAQLLECETGSFLYAGQTTHFYAILTNLPETDVWICLDRLAEPVGGRTTDCKLSVIYRIGEHVYGEIKFVLH